MSAFNTPWLRLWADMPNDPKWRTIARASGQSIGNVMAVYLHVLVNASGADDRGTTQRLQAEDVASALDVDSEQVQSILAAMQGRVLNGERVSGWAARQPAREDGAAERAKAWRDNQKRSERDQTQPNARERSETDTETDKEKDTQTARGNCGQVGGQVNHQASHQVELLDNAPSLTLAVCAALKAEGITHVTHSHPEIMALVGKGADAGQFVAAAQKAKAKGKGLAYTLGIVRGQLADAQGIVTQAMNAAASVTVPARPGIDPALAKIIADQLITKGPPAHIRARMAELSKKETV